MRTVLVIRDTSETDMYSGLVSLGVQVRTEDADGNPVKTEAKIGRCFGLPMTIQSGECVASICVNHMDDDLYSKIANFFAVDWETGLTEPDENGDEVPVGWPVYTVEYTDDAGKTQTRQQGAPRIAI